MPSLRHDRVMATFHARQAAEGIKIELFLTRTDIDLLLEHGRYTGIEADDHPWPDKVDAVADVIITLMSDKSGPDE
jgi:hypothetical protein